MWEYFKTKITKKQFIKIAYSVFFIILFAIRNILVYFYCVMGFNNNIYIRLEPH